MLVPIRLEGMGRRKGEGEEKSTVAKCALLL